MTRLLLSFILTFIFFATSAKSIQEIKDYLARQNYRALKDYVDQKSTSNVYAFFVLSRDLTNKYQEAVIDINEVFPDSVRPGFGSFKTYRVNIIADSTEIIYYDFCKKKVVGGDWGNIVFEPVDSFRNETSMSSFRADFNNIYNTPINLKDLFIDNIIYGFSCSKGNQRPEFRKKLDFILKSKDFKILNEWLKSANVEKQLYAIDGLYQLKKHGRKLTDEETQMIETVRLKKGEIKTCSGCLISGTTINNVIEDIVTRQKAGHKN